MVDVIIRNPIIQFTGPTTLIAHTEEEMTALRIDVNAGKVVQYLGDNGVYEKGAYYKIVADRD